MSRIKNAATSVKEFVDDHKTGITIFAVGTVTTAICAQINKLAMQTSIDFIEDHGLTDEYKNYLTEL